MEDTSQATFEPSPPAALVCDPPAAPESDPPADPADPVAPPATPPMDPDDESRSGAESRIVDKPRDRGGRGR